MEKVHRVSHFRSSDTSWKLSFVDKNFLKIPMGKIVENMSKFPVPELF